MYKTKRPITLSLLILVAGQLLYTPQIEAVAKKNSKLWSWLKIAGGAVVLIFSSVPATRAANAGTPILSTIASAMIMPACRPGLIIRGCIFFILI